MNRYIPLIALGILLLYGIGKAQAQIFKCTDASGKQVFADKPCEGAKRETLNLRFRGVAASVTPALMPAPLSQSTGGVAPLPSAPSSASAEQAAPPIAPKAPEIPLADRLANQCVDVYRGHLAYPQGVRIIGRTLEKSLSEYLITVQVKTISNPATPARIDPIFIDEKFICVTDGGSGLNARSTDMYVKRHKDGQRL